MTDPDEKRDPVTGEMVIEGEEVERLIRQLAAMLGVDETEAITIAVRERLERIKAAGEPK
jgi:hypothetical protein